MSTDLNAQTWPERIYLQSEDEHGTGTCEFISSHEITWCEDQISAHDVKYVRADLARAQPVAAIPEATGVTLPKGFVAKHVEGHGWIIDPPSGSRWVAFEGTPVFELLAALRASLPAIPEAGQSVPKLTDAQCHKIYNQAAVDCDEWADGLLFEPSKSEVSRFMVRAIFKGAVIASMSADANVAAGEKA